MTVGWMRFIPLVTVASDLVLGSSCPQKPFLGRRKVSNFHFYDEEAAYPSPEDIIPPHPSLIMKGNFFSYLKHLLDKQLEDIYYR